MNLNHRFIEKINLSRVSFFFLIIAITTGLFVRLAELFNLNINLRHFIHGHSHIAFWGWAQIASCVLIEKALNRSTGKVLRKSFLIIDTGIISASFFAFIFKGYWFISIILSIIHIILSWLWSFSMLKDIYSEKNQPAFISAKIAILFSILSGFLPL